MYEIISLHPLFPGQNEVDQIHKIHTILGSPGKVLLDKFKSRATNIDFSFQE